MAFSSKDLQILAKQNNGGLVQPVTNADLLFETNNRIQSAKHSTLWFWPIDEVDRREVAYSGNTIVIPNRIIPYNSTFFRDHHDLWVTFDEYKTQTAVSVVGGQVFIDPNVLFLLGGTSVVREYERFTISLPDSPITLGTPYFTAANFQRSRSTPIQVIYGRDIALDMARSFNPDPNFTVLFEGTLDTASQTDQFDFDVPHGLNAMHLEARVTNNTFDVTVTLSRMRLNDTIPGNDPETEIVLSFPPSVAGVQQYFDSPFRTSSKWRLTMTGGGAAEAGTWTIALTWKVQ